MDILLHKIAEIAGSDLIGVVDLKLLNKLYAFYLADDIKDVAFYSGCFSERLYPQNEWKSARGIICFGVCYNFNIPRPDDMANRGIISKCAYGEDYHKVLKRIGRRIMDEFTKSHPCEYKIFVDTGKLSDRMLAYAAGLGFIGKNGFLINEHYGSYVFIGHILTDIALNGCSDVAENACGSCEQCLKACPCGAYGKKGLNYFECISYKTQKGIAADSSGYLYGCDICQEACPYNKNAANCSNESFFTDAEHAYPKIEYILNMDDAEFKNAYGSSSLAWRGADILKKNALNIKKYGIIKQEGNSNG